MLRKVLSPTDQSCNPSAHGRSDCQLRLCRGSRKQSDFSLLCSGREILSQNSVSHGGASDGRDVNGPPPGESAQRHCSSCCTPNLRSNCQRRSQQSTLQTGLKGVSHVFPTFEAVSAAMRSYERDGKNYAGGTWGESSHCGSSGANPID